MNKNFFKFVVGTTILFCIAIVVAYFMGFIAVKGVLFSLIIILVMLSVINIIRHKRSNKRMRYFIFIFFFFTVVIVEILTK